ncbi:AMP-binding protein [Umezawaea endophytica]|uniref:AMP-binding protein n=1 Tax=Umezawaea endophytica TaxID=1654476 RepID=A0A9X3AI13_9PSEU|nr:AMP-binding protein [Umezawaea endophytica]MCS7482432.1 AMP-binding protein [Umezawaea endophytica]
MTVPEVLEDRAREPGRPAIRQTDGTVLTFGAWHARAMSFARRLRASGVGAGDRVGLLFGEDEWTDYAVAFCAVLIAGATAVPLSTRVPDVLRNALLTRCEARTLVHGRTAVEFAGGTTTEAADGPAAELDVVPPEAAAQVLFTSGTDGSPKGVVATHANLIHGYESRRRSWGRSRYFAHAFPIGTNAGQTMLLNALTAEAAALVAARPDVAELCAAVERYRAGSLFLVPATAIELVNSAAWSRHDLTSLALVGSTGAALPPAVALELSRALPDATLVNYYSSTEAAPGHVAMAFDPTRPTALGTGDVRVVGEEVWLRAPVAPRTPLHDNGSPAPVDGWIRTGDLGRLDDDGYLHLIDRESDLVKVGGHRVSTLAVEAALHEHPGVLDAAVLGLPHPRSGTVLAAAVVATAADVVEGLRVFLAERLSPAEVPARLLRVDLLPRNAAGKVVKRDLVGLFAVEAVLPLTSPVERALGRVWSTLLGLREVHADDDFLALGGDSLLTLRLAKLCSEEFDVDLSAAALFATPVLAEQARLVLDRLSPQDVRWR